MTRTISNRILVLLAVACGMAIAANRSHAAAYIGSDTRLWTNGVVPFQWDPDFILENKLRVVSAMLVWQEVANVTFVLRTNEPNYVTIRNAGPDAGSSSPTIGMGGGEQFLNIREDWSNWSDTAVTYGLAHELGHVLGFYHNHQRADRDLYVDVIEERINDCRLGNFTLEPTSLAWPRNIFDFDSVMSYGQCVFSICNYDFDTNCTCNGQGCTRWDARDCNTEFCCRDDTVNCAAIEVLPPNEDQQGVMGQRSHLSKWDAKLMSFLYPQSNWCFVEQDYAGSQSEGTFHKPHKTLLDAIVDEPDGSVVWVEPDTYTEPIVVYFKPMTIRATHGSVEIRH